MAQKFAVFDIDGTLIRWQLYHAVVDTLAKAKLIDAGLFETARRARLDWKKRTTATAYKDYERELVKLFDAAIVNISYQDFMAAVQSVFDEYKQQTYIFTRDLIHSLKAQNYLLFAISGSHVQIVELLAQHYGFDDWGGSEYELVEGRFNGRSFTLHKEAKPALLQRLATKHGASYQGSIGVGDSESDIPMLDSVEQPIAFNPSRLLFEHAEAHHWRVVVERKNMIYELEAHDGSYLLA